MIDFIFSITRVTALQLFSFFGIFFIFGYLLYIIQSNIHKRYREVFGWYGILWTAWIGTPIHELGHAFFAKIFGHKIQRISLYKPNKKTGSLGQVDHSYNNRNPYQQIGHFFIGSAPLIFGSIIIYLLTFFLLPHGKQIFSSLFFSSLPDLYDIMVGIWQILIKLFSKEYFSLWQYWLYIYLVFSITSHMAPSKTDLRGMYLGLVWIVCLVFVMNIIFYLTKIDITTYLLRNIGVFSIFLAMFILSFILSTIHLIVVSILFYPLKR